MESLEKHWKTIKKIGGSIAILLVLIEVGMYIQAKTGILEASQVNGNVPRQVIVVVDSSPKATPTTPNK